jgi:hypothetical protein
MTSFRGTASSKTCTKLTRLSMDKRSSLFVRSVSEKKKKSLRIFTCQDLNAPGVVSTTLHFLCSLRGTNKLERFITLDIRLERLVSDKHPSLLSPFKSCEENVVLGIWPLE